MIPMRASLDALVRAVAATVPLSLAALAARFLTIHVMGASAQGTIGRILVVAIAAVAGLVVGGAALWAVRYPALDQVTRRLLRRVHRA